MITTNTFLIGIWVVVGVGVGVGDEETEELTLPQPMIRARMGKLKKPKRARLKVLTPHEFLREPRADRLA
jgi:hypothetical protein